MSAFGRLLRQMGHDVIAVVIVGVALTAWFLVTLALKRRKEQRCSNDSYRRS
jgi:hypothetical protein